MHLRKVLTRAFQISHPHHNTLLRSLWLIIVLSLTVKECEFHVWNTCRVFIMGLTEFFHKCLYLARAKTVNVTATWHQHDAFQAMSQLINGCGLHITYTFCQYIFNECQLHALQTTSPVFCLVSVFQHITNMCLSDIVKKNSSVKNDGLLANENGFFLHKLKNILIYLDT